VSVTKIDDQHNRTIRIKCVAPYLSLSQADEAIAVTRRAPVICVGVARRAPVAGSSGERYRRITGCSRRQLERLAALSTLAPYLTDAQRAEFIALLLDHVPIYGRADGLNGFANSIKDVIAVGGPGALETIHMAIKDVGAWWP
jgi:hypothetical protein